MLTLYDDPMIREIYRRGARDACEWACVYLPSAKQRVMEEWLTALDLWVEGNPPTAPHSRADTSA